MKNINMSGVLKCGATDRHGTDADTCGVEDSVGNGRGNSNNGCAYRKFRPCLFIRVYVQLPTLEKLPEMIP